MSRRVFFIRFFFVHFVRIVSEHRLLEPPVVSMYRSSVCGCSLFVVSSAHVDFPFARIFASMICLAVPSFLAVPSCPAAPSRSAIFLRLFRSDCIRTSPLRAACVSRLVLADVPASIFPLDFSSSISFGLYPTSPLGAACVSRLVLADVPASIFPSDLSSSISFGLYPDIGSWSRLRQSFSARRCPGEYFPSDFSSSISFGLYPNIGSWSRPLWHMQMRYELFLQKYLQIPIIFRTFALAKVSRPLFDNVSTNLGRSILCLK